MRHGWGVMPKRSGPLCLVSALLLSALAGSNAAAAADKSPAIRDGSHDFDWEFGEWQSNLRRKPAGSDQWLHYTGTTKVAKVLDGEANLVELVVKAPDGQVFKALNLRLYNPDSGQWSANYSNMASGVLAVPAIGEFRNGVGEFYDYEMLGGRNVLVRFVISNISPTTAHFEQSISSDGGRTWTTNWIVDDTRVGAPPSGFTQPGR